MLVGTDQIRQIKKDKHSVIRAVFVAAIVQQKLLKFASELSRDFAKVDSVMCRWLWAWNKEMFSMIVASKS